MSYNGTFIGEIKLSNYNFLPIVALQTATDLGDEFKDVIYNKYSDVSGGQFLYVNTTTLREYVELTLVLKNKVNRVHDYALVPFRACT